MKKLCIFLGILVMVLGLSVSAQATLVDMHDGTVYDTDTQLSWLKDAMAVGARPWDDAVTWAESLNTLNAGSGFAGLTGWRLPTTTQPDAACSVQYDFGGGIPVQGEGYYCMNSELGHLYYTELDNPAGGHVTNIGPFTNLQVGYYWSGTEFAPNPVYAWYFGFFYNGYQRYNLIYNMSYAWAVRPGARTLPTPVGYNPQWLLITLVSLMGAGGYMLRRRTAPQ